MDITCCHVAIGALIVNVISLGIYAGYNIKMSQKQLELEKKNKELTKEVQEVERVNGKEKRDIQELQDKVKQLERKNNHE